MENKTLSRFALGKLSRGQSLTFDEAEYYLVHNVPHSTQMVYSAGAGLVRAKYFYAQLGSPQESFKTVHIAGTSGKGSVTHILSHLLKHHGFKVGSFVSPHVYDLRERVLLNCEMISKQQFARITSRLISHALAMQHSRHGQPSFFEMINGIAFQTFAEEEVDYAVIETGLGGLYDSTNSIVRQDKLALITALGLDHTQILGETIEAIAAQKGGIIPKGGQVIAWKPRERSVRDVLQHQASEQHSDLSYVSDTDFSYIATNGKGVLFDYHSENLTLKNLQISLHGAHQAQNASLALRALETLASRDGFKIRVQAIRDALQSIAIPARFETRAMFGRQAIFDGAHNPQKMAAFVQAVRDSGIKEANWVIALKESKDSRGVLQLIAPYVRNLFVTGFESTKETMFLHSSQSPYDLAAIALAVGIKNVQVYDDNVLALRAACVKDDDKNPVIVTGSFYLIGDIDKRLSD